MARFGNLSGPWQHLAQARLRAVETGLPLMRAANTGVSAVIDARGQLRATLGLNWRGGSTPIVGGIAADTMVALGRLAGAGAGRIGVDLRARRRS
ncbi:MAG: nitrilase-related carbon-nitrogen hydrolase [Paracoccus sp. (in: a-proteobacteria)]